MPKYLKAVFRDYGISIILLSVFSFVVLFHGSFIRNAVLLQAQQINKLKVAVDKNSEVVKGAAETFTAASKIIEEGTKQSEASYAMIVANRKTLLQILELLFLPIEKRTIPEEGIPGLNISPPIEIPALPNVPQE